MLAQTVVGLTAVFIQLLEWVLLRKMVAFQHVTPWEELAVKVSQYREGEKKLFCYLWLAFGGLIFIYLGFFFVVTYA